MPLKAYNATGMLGSRVTAPSKSKLLQARYIWHSRQPAMFSVGAFSAPVTSRSQVMSPKSPDDISTRAIKYCFCDLEIKRR